MGDKVVAQTLVNPNPLTRYERTVTINVIEDELERFIDQFWVEFNIRQARTDLQNDETGCFSEAPCEAFFSIFDRITHFRQTLTVEHVVMLTRIQTEGPSAGTVISHNLTHEESHGKLPDHLTLR